MGTEWDKEVVGKVGPQKSPLALLRGWSCPVFPPRVGGGGGVGLPFLSPRVPPQAMQILGGMGYVTEMPAERQCLLILRIIL